MNWRDLAPSSDAWTGRLYGRFRLLLGVYLFVHFAQLAPWAAEVFSSAGVLPDARLSPLSAAFPNLLRLVDGPGFVTGFVAAGALVAVAFAIGAADRAGALFLFYLLACLHGRNPLIANPSLPYVGWVLLAHVALPRLGMGVGIWRAEGQLARWRFPRAIFVAAWILLAAGYSFSGGTKFESRSWLDGTAIARVLDSPLARPGLIREAMLQLPSPILRGLSYGALALELLFLPLSALPKLRRWLWLAMLAMHLSLTLLIDFADLSLGMVMFHLFVADPRWFRFFDRPPRSAES